MTTPCGRCAGTGATPKKKLKCRACGGSGSIPRPACPACGRNALSDAGVCASCGVGVGRGVAAYAEQHRRPRTWRAPDGRRAMGDFEDGILSQSMTKRDR